jgi:hypothetical protein
VAKAFHRGAVYTALVWFTAFAAVASFYVRAILDMKGPEAPPYAVVAIAAGLGCMAAAGIARFAFRGVAPRRLDLARQLGLLCGALALGLGVASTLFGLDRDSMTIADWGVFGVNIGIPVLLLCCPGRARLLEAVGAWCVVFACADAVANALSFAGVVTLAKHVGHEGQSYGLHFQGLCGNILAEGTVAFLAVTFLAVPRPGGGRLAGLARLGLAAALLGSLWLAGSRTYLAITLAALPFLRLKWIWRLPLALVSAAVAGAFLLATFAAPYDDYDDILRGWLLEAGWQKAQDHPFLGLGSFYRDVSTTQADYISAMSSGVTESSGLDYAIAYGLPAAVLLILCAVFTLGARRRRPAWPVVVLVMFTGALAIAGPQGSFLGSIVYYGSLIYGLFDEDGRPGDPVFARLRPDQAPDMFRPAGEGRSALT